MVGPHGRRMTKAGDTIEMLHDNAGLYLPFSVFPGHAVGSLSHVESSQGDRGIIVEWAQGYYKDGPCGRPDDVWKISIAGGVYAIKQGDFRVLTALDLMVDALN